MSIVNRPQQNYKYNDKTVDQYVWWEVVYLEL